MNYLYSQWEPLITVQLMACEKDYHLAPRAIASVAAQNLPPNLLHLQIVYDGLPSQEASELFEETCSSDFPLPVQVLFFEEATGYYTIPRNLALPAVHGIYVAFMDADNEMSKDHLRGLLQAIRTPDPEEGWPHFVYSRRLYVFDEGSRKTSEGKPLFKGPSPFIPWTKKAAARLIQSPTYNFVDTGDLLVSRSVLYELAERMGCVWNAECRRFGDWDLVCRLAHAGFRGKAVDQVTNIYHWTGKNVSTERQLSELTILPLDIYHQLKDQGKILM